MTIMRRAGSGLLAAGVCLTVLGSAPTATAAVATPSSAAGAARTSLPTDWFADPLTSLERRRLAAVPDHPGDGDRKRSTGTRTAALHRTASGDLAVPASVVRGHQLVAGQAVVAPVRFGGRSAALSPRSRVKLDRLRPSTELVGALRCEGHNDYQRHASASAGDRLATARAAAVCRWLDGGRAQVSTTAFSAGSAHPIVIGPHRRRGFDPRTLNRRVIVTVTADKAVVAPGAVDLVEAVPGDGLATLTFSAPAEDGGAPVTGYEVSTDGGDTWSALTYTGVGPYTAVLVDLVNATTYTVAVRAVSSAGPGAASGTVTVTPAPPVSDITFPYPPHTHGGDIHFSMTAPSSEGGSAVVGFEYSHDGGAWTTIPPQELMDLGGAYDVWLYPGNPVSCGDPFRVRAVTEAGPGAATGNQPLGCP